MTDKKTTNDRGQSDKGVAFIEMAISLPVCVFLLLSILDIGVVLKRYVSISRIAYEGVRLASDHSRLTPGDPEDPYVTQGNIPEGFDSSHREVQKRIYKVIEGYSYKPSDFTVSTTRYDSEDRVQVTIISPPLKLFNSFLENKIVVSSTVDGPYLYINKSNTP